MISALLCVGFDLTRTHRACRVFQSLLRSNYYFPSVISPAIDSDDHSYGSSVSKTNENDMSLTLKTGTARIPGSTHIGEKAAANNLFEMHKEKIYDVLYSFDFFSLELCSRLQAYYRSLGHRCLWFHDQHKGTPRSTIEVDDFQIRRAKTLKKLLLQTDAISTVSDTASEFLYTHFRLPNRPVVLKDYVSKDILKTAQKIIRTKSSVSKTEKKHIFYAGDINNNFLLKYLIQLVGQDHYLYLNQGTSDKEDFLKQHSGLSKQIAANIIFLKDNESVPHIGFDAVVVEGNPSFEIENYDYIFSIHANTKPIFFIPKSKHGNNISDIFDELNIEYYNPLAPPHFQLHSLYDFLCAPLKKNNCALISKDWENSSEHYVTSLIDNYLWRLEDREPVETTARVEDLRVLHGLTGAAGQPWMLSRAQRRLGMRADTFCADGNKFAYRSDKTLLNLDFNALSSFIKSHAPKYDIFQFYFRSYYFNKIVLSYPTAIDLLALKAAGKRIVFYFMGSEVRFHSMYKKFSPFNYVDEKPGNVANFPEETQRRMYNIFNSIADCTAVSDPEMESYIPGTTIIERSIDLDEWRYCPPLNNDRPLIVHAPSRQVVKGSASVLRTLESLKEKGVDFDFELVENLTQDKAREVYKRADIVVDQMRIGWYGFLSVEAMALGKTVVCYIRDDLLDNFGSDGPPLAVANPDTIEHVLLQLIENPSLREMYGLKGRQFVENVHAKEKVAKKFMDLYQTAVECPKPLDMEEVAKYLVYQTDYMNQELNRLRMKAR